MGKLQPAVASEGHIIAVKGYKDVPFAANDVAFAVGTDKHWNFRSGSGGA
jgi:hypothetical protein